MLGSLRTGRPRPQRRPRAGELAAAARPDEEVYARARASARATTSRKNGFDHVVLGLSGGIDSALVACVAVDALGAGRA